MNKKLIDWGIFILLSIIWGSSFLLMKIGMKEGAVQLSPYQVASLRMIFAGLVLVPFAFKAFKQIPKDKLGIVILSGVIGNFIPAYLFCIAETKIDSALAGILNSLTPLFTILVGIIFFKIPSNGQKMLGVLLGLVGLCLSVVAGKTLHFENFSYSFFIMLATICYGLNVNMVGKNMQNISAINIASIAFSFSIIPGMVILYFTGYFQYDFSSAEIMQATLAGGTLGVINTSVASILFYILVKRSGIIFASTVTYAIPFVSLAMGLLYNEAIHPLRLVGLAIILVGVYIVNKRND
ncbi:MAG: DMT family transporter [Chitinophagaceae bacterium]|jgi:drug/metabolite transporter (DMT)-like permease|nr:MAG: DMT family transporter [Chitinophagaceae bacterium]